MAPEIDVRLRFWRRSATVSRAAKRARPRGGGDQRPADDGALRAGARPLHVGQRHPALGAVADGVDDVGGWRSLRKSRVSPRNPACIGTPWKGAYMANDSNGADLGFEKELWQAADKLRGNMDAAEYKHVVLGLIFLKYISDAFEEQHAQLEAERARAPTLRTATNTAPRTSSGCPRRPAGPTFKANAKQPTIGKLIDDAMVAIERENPSLKGVLPKDYARPRLDKQRLGELIDLIGNIGLGDKAKPLQGHPRPRLRILPRPVRQRRRQEGRPVLHAALRRQAAGRDARTLQGPRLRPLLRLGRHVRAVGEVRRSPRRPRRRHQHLRAGIQPHHLATGAR